SCSPCANGLACKVAGDCSSSSTCKGLRCTALCADGAKDNGESDVDCGGTCSPCADGLACKVSGDCGAASTCKSLICIPTTCTNSSLDPGETDVDCGG